MTNWQHRTLETNGIRMHVVEQGAGPLVVLCHGFPESWYSWRHQIEALAGAGYRVVAPDQRGYGRTEAPESIEAYDLCHLAADIVGLIYALNEEKACIVGHDWGSAVAWTCALLRPDIFESVCLMSVPYIPFSPGVPKPTDRMRGIAGGNHFYQLYFQEPGLAERELEEDVALTVRKTLYSGSGAAERAGQGFAFLFDRSTRFVDALSAPESHPSWLTEEDVEFFTEEFRRTGFRGGLNWYRNMDRNQELLSVLQHATIRQPSLFIAGAHDVVITMYRPYYEGLEQTMPGLTKKQLIPGAGHWVQQESPDEVNRLLLAFLGREQTHAASPQ